MSLTIRTRKKIHQTLASKFGGWNIDDLIFNLSQDHGFDPNELAMSGGFDNFEQLLQSNIMQNHVIYDRNSDGPFVYRARITPSERDVYEEQLKWSEEEKLRAEKKQRRLVRECGTSGNGCSTGSNFNTNNIHTNQYQQFQSQNHKNYSKFNEIHHNSSVDLGNNCSNTARPATNHHEKFGEKPVSNTSTNTFNKFDPEIGSSKKNWKWDFLDSNSQVHRPRLPCNDTFSLHSSESDDPSDSLIDWECDEIGVDNESRQKLPQRTKVINKTSPNRAYLSNADAYIFSSTSPEKSIDYINCSNVNKKIIGKENTTSSGNPKTNQSSSSVHRSHSPAHSTTSTYIEDLKSVLLPRGENSRKLPPVVNSFAEFAPASFFRSKNAKSPVNRYRPSPLYVDQLHKLSRIVIESVKYVYPRFLLFDDVRKMLEYVEPVFADYIEMDEDHVFDFLDSFCSDLVLSNTSDIKTLNLQWKGPVDIKLPKP